MVSGLVSKAVGEFTARRHPAKGRLVKTSGSEEARLQEAFRVHDASAVTKKRRWSDMEYPRRM